MQGNQTEWSVPDEGYRWVAGFYPSRKGMARKHADGTAPEPSWFLVPRCPTELGGVKRAYEPLQEVPPLLRTFVRIEPSRASILRFANQFGWLGSSSRFIPAKVGGVDYLIGESFDHWRQLIGTLRDLVRLFDLCVREDEKELARHIVWSSEWVVSYRSQPLPSPDFKDWQSFRKRVASIFPNPLRKHVSPPVPDEWRKRVPPGDVVLPAWVYLQREVNHELRGTQLPSLRWNKRTRRLELCMVPPRLKNLLWLQLAEWTSGRITYHECPVCGRWIRVGTGCRSNRQYCSSACRTKALRIRQDVACRLYKAGKTVLGIAEYLGSNPIAVSRWIRRV